MTSGVGVGWVTRTRRAAALGAAALLVALSPVGGGRAASAATAPPVLAWGQDSYGQLGDGNLVASQPSPVVTTLPAGTVARSVAAGYDHSLVVTSGGQVYAAGNNNFGQLGIGGVSGGAATAVPVTLPSGDTVTQAAAGDAFSLAVTGTGGALAWGDDEQGELGDGSVSTTPSPSPVAISLPPGVTVTQVAAGIDGFGLALTSTGAVLAWGDNTFGELGNGTTGGSDPTPAYVALPSGTTVTEVAAGGGYALALTSAGTVLAWGYNGGGTLGNGTTTSSDVPVSVSLPPGATVTQVSAEGSVALARTGAGGVLAWGGNSAGQLGDGSVGGSSDTPVAASVPAGVFVTQVAAGGSFGLAVTSAGGVLAWGEDVWGELGNGTTGGPDPTPAPVAIPAGDPVASVAAGQYHALAVTEPPPTVTALSPPDGTSAGGTTVTITGTGFTGVTAVHFGTAAASFRLVSPTTITAVAPAGSGTVDVTVTGPTGTSAPRAADQYTWLTTGSALAWGEGDDGALGNGQLLSSPVPVGVHLPPGVTTTQTTGSFYTSYALTSTGTVLAWGENFSGELGNGTVSGTFQSVPAPVHLPAGTKVVAVAASAYDGFALTSTGSVLAWGEDQEGELGNGTTGGPSGTPTAVHLPAGVTVTAIAAGYWDVYALTSTGSVLAWGYDTDGELGNGTTTLSPLPVPVSLPSGTKVSAIAAADYDGYVVTSTGSVLSWGYNADGELGNGTTTASPVPVAVHLPAGTVVTKLVGEAYTPLALTATGTVLSWGANFDGELGNGTVGPHSLVPVDVALPAGTRAVGLGGGYEAGLVLTSTGTVLSWGANFDGDLGTGSALDNDVPVPSPVDLPPGITVASLGKSQGYTSLAIVGSPPAAAPSPALYVANSTNGTITEYAAGATGDAAPLATLAGTATGLAGPRGLFVDATGRLWVANQAGDTVTEYAAGATGDAAPVATLAGAATGLSGPTGMVLDAAGHLFVTDQADNTVTEYAAGATGDAAPIARLSGSATGLSAPTGVALDAAGHLFVTDQADNTVTEYAAGATGDAAPIARLSGSATGLASPRGIVVDAAGHLRVSNPAANTVTVYADGATGNTAPLTSLSGSATGLDQPSGMDVNRSGQVAVADPAAQAVTIYAGSSTGAAAPVATLAGSATGLDGPMWLAFTPPPVAATGPAVHVTARAATLTGTVTSDGSTTAWAFAYRAGHGPWKVVRGGLLPPAAASHPVSIRVTRLVPGTRYRFRLVAVNPGGRAIGQPATFRTRPWWWPPSR